MRNGEQIEYYDNGIIELKCNWINDELDGEYKEYYNDGSIYSKGNYKDGKRDGAYIYYYKSGNVRYKRYYKDDHCIEDIPYFNNGKIDKKNIKNGKHVSYFEGEKMECNYKDNILHGECIEYYDNGIIRCKSIYKKGIIIKKVNYLNIGGIYDK